MPEGSSSCSLPVMAGTLRLIAPWSLGPVGHRRPLAFGATCGQFSTGSACQGVIHDDEAGGRTFYRPSAFPTPSPAAWRCWRRCAAPRHRVSAAKRTPSGETAWGPEVRQFRLWAEQRGYGGMGSRPVRLNSITQQRTPLQRQLRLCIAQTICSYHSRFRRKGAILRSVLGRG